ncbi:fused DSP-PTPase phosphatase/NAD kinase-like protein [Inconstantimicrobium mannanitabidum]|uniref:Uncharacterized protein n=1 Tax=Inconstantimicrobium mannanitabidum TaxID=1604901 RepID=A0ACB5RC25_9CLOT|nr:phytase [Clostridium sp. TW13]GKX66685.1 hypothetical protein rsdtw13_19430 [Clostridium sp. TW13]
MRKLTNFKLILYILVLPFVFLLSANANNYVMLANSSNSDEIQLILDNVHYDKLPNHFRTTSNLAKLKNSNFNLAGLNELNISGSQQFSKNNLSILLKNIGTNLPITIIDLRQESHGFINEFPVSWENKRDNANTGLSVSQITMRERSLLKDIPLNQPLTFTNKPEVTVIPKTTFDEQDLVKENNLSYLRLPVTDYELPTNQAIDYFTQFVKKHPRNTWIHFHCKEGVGRTTTFMIMYDIMKNCNLATLDEIIQRQTSLPSFDTSTIENFSKSNNKDFFSKFYFYCKANGKDLNPSWSNWLKLNP